MRVKRNFLGGEGVTEVRVNGSNLLRKFVFSSWDGREL